MFVYFCRKDGKPPNFFVKAAIGMSAGGVGAFVGTPAEVALIRMTADGRSVLYTLNKTDCELEKYVPVIAKIDIAFVFGECE